MSQTARRERRTSADFVGRDPFTPIEKLSLLVEGIELSLVAPGMMAEKMLQTIRMDGSEPDLAIASDDPGSAVYRVAQSDVSTSAAIVRQLQHLLAELKAEIEASSPGSAALSRARPPNAVDGS